MVDFILTILVVPLSTPLGTPRNQGQQVVTGSKTINFESARRIKLQDSNVHDLIEIKMPDRTEYRDSDDSEKPHGMVQSPSGRILPGHRTLKRTVVVASMIYDLFLLLVLFFLFEIPFFDY